MLKYYLLLISVWMSGSHSEYTSAVIDISHWQENVNFTEVKDDGIAAVIHKATQGTTYVDKRYSERRELAEKEGLLWGAYHFAVGGNATAQADHFLDTVGNTDKVLLVVDLEDNRKNNMSPEGAEEFIGRVMERTGRHPMVYGSRYFLEQFDRPLLRECSLWIASWNAGAVPSLPWGQEEWVLWQYTDGVRGGEPKSVRGIGNCDRDRYNGTLEQLVTCWPHL